LLRAGSRLRLIRFELGRRPSRPMNFRRSREDFMKHALRMLPVILGAGLLFAVPAQARNYDCSKAGNANKTACKGAAAAPAATPAPAAAPAPKAAPAARHYDCTKAGNANKAVCKGATTAAAPAPSPAAPAPTPYRPAAPSAPAATHATASRSSAPATTNPAGPNGATAVCNDGSYSHSAHRSGTCSRHGGVKTWY
jgi:hypothetical protein